jgi:hypothetical protein
MDYETTVKTLMTLVKQANLADTYISEDWQRTEDSKIYFGHLRSALDSIGALGVLTDWANNGDEASLFARKVS